MPLGLSVADMLAGAAAVQGILAALVRRGVSGEGAHVETSLLEAMIDLQFEFITTHLNNGRRLPERARAHGASAYLAAPYGVYRTRDGHLALAMTPLTTLAELLELPALATHALDPSSAFTNRSAILDMLAVRLAAEPTQFWIDRLEAEGVWCAEVLKWPAVLEHESFIGLDMLQRIKHESGVSLETTRLPVSFNGVRPVSQRAAPRLGAHTNAIRIEFGL